MIFEEGYRIGAYRVVRILGQGGMGDVYEVEHVELGTHYALKAFACDYEEAETLRRKFFEEGKLLARLQHPRIVHVFDLAIEPVSQMPYFVMDLVLYEDGESHTVEDVDKADIDENLVYFWFKDVAEALDYIHEQGIVHRDIKPSNMMLGKDLHVTLTDFGISRIFGGQMKQTVGAERTFATKTGQGKLVLGTEHYMAPEVAAGEEATPAADAYALGMMCFRLLTGLWYEHGTDALSLLAKYKLRWMAVLPQLLSPHAERRPKELYKLKERLKGNVVSAPQAEPKEAKTPKRPKRRKNDWPLAIVIATVILGLMGGFGWMGYQNWLDRRSNAARLSEMQRQIAEQGRKGANVVTNTVVKIVENAKPETKELDFGEIKSDLLDQLEEATAATEAESPLGSFDGVTIREVVYGAFQEKEPVEGQTVDITKQIVGRLYGGERKIRICNSLAGRDPASRVPKQARIRYEVAGVASEVMIAEGHEFELSSSGIATSAAGDPVVSKPFEIVKDVQQQEEEKVDYGPIPKKTYAWLKGGNKNSPQPVSFQMANGTVIDLIPFKPCEAYIFGHCPAEAPDKRKAIITRPYWVSKFCLTAAAFREFDEGTVADCLPVEKAVGSQYPVSKSMTRAQTEAFCRFLSKKYATQLPEGYVFRLPSDAEWQNALSIERHYDNSDNAQTAHWWREILFDGDLGKREMTRLRQARHLDSIGDWEDNGWDSKKGIFIGGRCKPMITGICDPCNHRQFLLDTKAGDEPLQSLFVEEATDPLLWAAASNPGKEIGSLVLTWERNYEVLGAGTRLCGHIVLGPDLVKEKAWLNARKPFPTASSAKPPVQRRFHLDPKRVPAKISSPKEVCLKMACGQEMTFCTIPKVKEFSMSNPDGQAKMSHKVELTYPFWITKDCVTIAQWREFGKY